MNSTFEVNQLINRACMACPGKACIATLHGMKATAQRLAEYNHGYRHTKRLLKQAPGCPSAIEYAINNSAMHSDDWKRGARHAFRPETIFYSLSGASRVTSPQDVLEPGNHTTYVR